MSNIFEFSHIARRKRDNLKEQIMFGTVEGEKSRGKDGQMELQLLQRSPHTLAVQELKI